MDELYKQRLTHADAYDVSMQQAMQRYLFPMLSTDILVEPPSALPFVSNLIAKLEQLRVRNALFVASRLQPQWRFSARNLGARQAYVGISTRAQQTLDNNTGMLLVAASQLFFSLMNVAVKKLNSLDPPVAAFELIFIRMAITWICCVTYMFIMKVPDPFLGPKGVRLLLVLRGFFGFFGLFGIYYSLQYLSLSDATVLTFLAPMCTAVTCALLLHETFSWREALAGLFSLVGVVLIARPEFLFGRHDIMLTDAGQVVDGVSSVTDAIAAATPAQRLGAVGVALLGVLGATGAYTTIRAVGKRAHPLHNLVSFSSQCVIVSTAAMIIMRTPVVVPRRWDWLAMLLMIGIFGFIAQVLLTMGLQREAAGRGTMALYVQIIFATVFERVFFHTSPSLLSIIGTLIIITSAIYVAVTKEDSKAHKRNRSELILPEDGALEEGLLENHVDEPAEEAKEEDAKDLEMVSVNVMTAPVEAEKV
ncbi:hypothetical protein A0H81_07128 [Grifola frondosa]|uniref:EamA domain-containing protein n=1 Tax=Grifola frondosa TaxID=5627 RepID=A0A1C7M8X5_GRIFR|nr:hypothetical protein A0H81_07128 [Grifola frondosa]